MGGLGIILTIILFSLVFIDMEVYPQFVALIIMFFAFGLLGFADDITKVLKKQNLGLTFWQKILLQTIFAGAFSYFLVALGHNNSVAGFLAHSVFNLPIFYLLFSTFVIVGTANAANLTDGLDGLLAGTIGIAFIAMAILSARQGIELAETISLVAGGAALAFLYFNFPKAKVFMGDTCSLALGSLLAGLAIIIHKELLLMVVAMVFMVEALSVILQVSSYKLFKKRIFRMSPLHHHFELMGWKENIIVVVFWCTTLIFCIISLII